jgi:hypothetical protein
MKIFFVPYFFIGCVLQYYEKQITVREDHQREREGKRRKVNMVDVLSIQNECRIFKPGEITIRRGLR